MPVNLDSEILEQLPPALEQVQRGLFYGDQLFETIRVFEGRMPFLDRHMNRLFSGLKAMGYQVPENWNADFFRQEIRKISAENARVRLSVWRAPGGLYLPEHQHPHFLITTQALDSRYFQWRQPGLTLGLCDDVRLPVDAFSNLKTLNTARYVAAAQEAQRKGWDEGLLLNAREQVCEATSSNVFWIENQTLITVPLSEGCVAGAMREFVLEIATAADFAVQEKPATFAALLRSDEIFLTNAIRGIVPVRMFAGQVLTDFRTKRLFDILQEQVSTMLRYLL